MFLTGRLVSSGCLSSTGELVSRQAPKRLGDNILLLACKTREFLGLSLRFFDMAEEIFIPGHDVLPGEERASPAARRAGPRVDFRSARTAPTG